MLTTRLVREQETLASDSTNDEHTLLTDPHDPFPQGEKVFELLASGDQLAVIYSLTDSYAVHLHNYQQDEWVIVDSPPNRNDLADELVLPTGTEPYISTDKLGIFNHF